MTDAERVLVQTVLRGIPEGTAIDWPEVIRLAPIHGLTSLLYDAVSKDPQAPRPVVEELRNAYLLGARKTLAHYAELKMCLRLFEEHAIPVVVLKGLALGSTVYPSLALRPMRDVDLLIPIEAVARASELFKARGYSPSNLSWGESIDRSFEIEREFRQAGSGLKIDLHWHLFHLAYQRERIPIEWFWQHTVKLERDGMNMPTLSPEAHLLYLASHLAGHIDRRFIWSYDVVRILETYRDRFDWTLFVGAAKELRLSWSVTKAFEEAATVWGLDVPDSIHSQLRRQTTLAEQIALSPAHGSAWSYLVDGLSLLGWRRKLTWLWRVVFPGPDYLKQQYGMTDARMAPFYYLLRFWRAAVATLGLAKLSSKQRQPDRGAFDGR
jgi:hypothetical protein